MSPAELSGARRSGLRTAVVFFLMGFSTSGCATGGGDDPETELASRGEGLAVRVHNQNWSTVHCYLLLDSRSVSLGQVSTNRAETFTVGSGVLGGHRSVRLLADPVGSTDTYTTETILIDPGDRIEWTLRNPFSLSSIQLY
ncbi:MAG: hypothetical protein ACOC83_03225 [Gemmatimonadota bacterium]